MSHPVIIVENLSKSYILHHKNHGSYVALRDIIADKVKSTFGKKDRNFKETEEFLALDDVSFEIKSGDTVGIIGRNGAGKSTLLKILSRIVTPTKGTVTLEGRIASLLEVGTGFHPELSGRENIFLNGSILGMSRTEIKNKFDEIVAFAEIERFLDTPVKRYSSGMYVRLAFSVAAHLEPEILIVDEVLAVGDAEFQRKCLGKMENVSRNDGRTVLFVSHNMQAVQNLCNTGILLQKGKVIKNGSMEEVIKKYLESNHASHAVYEIAHEKNLTAPGYAYRIQIENENGKLLNEVPVGDNWQARVLFKLNKNVEGFIVALGIVNAFDTAIRTSWSEMADFTEGEYEAIFKNDDIQLTTGQYKLVVGLSSNKKAFQFVKEAGQLLISDAGINLDNKRIVNTESGLFLNPMNIQIIKK
jgi:lipopolysaccharide transport system ATP-binding protein